MKELEGILEAARDWHARGVEFALATVVGVRGSTYRGLAARQLVAADGTSVGTVSGGCLDQDLTRAAAAVIDGGEAELIEFDLTADDEAVWGWGIGCNGATRLVLEPASSVLDLASELERSERPVVIVHHLSDGRVGERTLVSPGQGGPYARVAQEAVEEGWHRVVETDVEKVMLEVVGASRRLVVCGAGHDAAPVVEYGAELGYEPIVVDDRRAFLTDERFPRATQLIQVSPSELATAVDLGPVTPVVIMSHNYLRDLDYLEAALGRRVPYIGVLGPGERLSRLLDDLAERNVHPDVHDLAALHGPAGLDIGAEGPVEIAWAVLSEILAVRRGKGGGFLRDRKGPEALRDYDRAGSDTRASGEPA